MAVNEVKIVDGYQRTRAKIILLNVAPLRAEKIENVLNSSGRSERKVLSALNRAGDHTYKENGLTLAKPCGSLLLLV